MAIASLSCFCRAFLFSSAFFASEACAKFCSTPFIASARSFCWLFCASLFGLSTGLFGAGFWLCRWCWTRYRRRDLNLFWLWCDCFQLRLWHWHRLVWRDFCCFSYRLWRPPVLVAALWLPAAAAGLAGAAAGVVAVYGSLPVPAPDWIWHDYWRPNWFSASWRPHPQ